MFKRLGVLTILIVLALVGSVPAVTAQEGPPEHVERGQALVTGSVWVQQTGVYFGGPEPIFPPPYEDVEDGPISRFVFNVRKGSEMVIHPVADIPVWEASGHLFWFKDGEVIRVDIQYMLQNENDFEPFDPAWWGPYYRCNYMSGTIGEESGMCFVVCDLPEPFVYVAAVDFFPQYRFDVLRSNVIIKE